VDDEERFPPFSSFCDFVKYFILNLFLSLLGPYLSPIRTRELFFTFHFVALKTVAIWLKKISTISYFLLFLVLQKIENVGDSGTYMSLAVIMFCFARIPLL